MSFDWNDVLPPRAAATMISDERCRQAHRVREKGMLFKDIGSWLGVGKERARDISDRGSRRLEQAFKHAVLWQTEDDKKILKRNAPFFIELCQLFQRSSVQPRDLLWVGTARRIRIK